MSPELNQLLIEILTGIIYGAAAGGVIGIIVCAVLLWADFRDWRK